MLGAPQVDGRQGGGNTNTMVPLKYELLSLMGCPLTQMGVPVSPISTTFIEMPVGIGLLPVEERLGEVVLDLSSLLRLDPPLQ